MVAECLVAMFSSVVLMSAAKTIVLDTKFMSVLTTGREGHRIFSETVGCPMWVTPVQCQFRVGHGASLEAGIRASGAGSW